MAMKRSIMLWAALACTAGASAQVHDWPMPGRDVQRSNYTPDKLRGWIDIPYAAVGDVCHIDRLAAAVRAHGKTAWRPTIEN